MAPIWWVILVFAGGLCGQTPQDPGFRAHIWTREGRLGDLLTPATLERLRLAGVSAEGPSGIEAARATGVPFYVDFAIPKGLFQRRKDDFDAARRSWLAGSPAIRSPCLRDPSALAGAGRDLARTLDALGDARPWIFSLTDEPSETRGLSPFDACTCPHCIAALPAFLATRWGSEARARKAWDSLWPAQGAPAPPSTADARKALFHDMGPTATLTAWHDHRAFADESFADAVTTLAQRTRVRRPDLSIALLGLNIPSLFGGLSPESLGPALSAYEAYTDAGADALWRSMADPKTRRIATVWVDRPTNECRARLWHAFLTGVHDVILYQDDGLTMLRDKDGNVVASQQITPLTTDIATAKSSDLAPWRRAAEFPAQVGIMYSMPSIRLNAILDTRFDGASWVNRLSSYEEVHATDARARRGWIALLNDLGLLSTFVTSDRLRRGTRALAELDGLVLPRMTALSDGECRRIREFASDRLVVADLTPACFTSRLERRALPALDDLFGVTRAPRSATSGAVTTASNRAPTIDELTIPPSPYDTAPALEAIERALSPTGTNPADSAGGRNIGIQRIQGIGRALLLNLSIGNYADDRFLHPQRAARLRSYLRTQLQGLRLRPIVECTVLETGAPVTVHLRKDDECIFVAVEVDLPPIGVTPTLSTSPTTVKLSFPGIFDVVDLLSHESLGPTNQVTVEARLGAPRFLQLKRH